MTGNTFGESQVQDQNGTDNQAGNEQGPSFDQGSAPQQQTAPQQQPPSQDGELRNQIGVLEKRLRDKDEFIETLKSERKQDSTTISDLQGRLEEMEKRSKSVEEVLERMQSSKGGQGEDGNQLTPEDAKKLAADVYSQHETQKVRQANFQSVKQELLQTYGNDKVDAKVAETAESLGMTFDEAFEMAEARPAAFKRLFIPADAKVARDPAGPSGSVNTQGLSNEAPQKSTKPFVSMSKDKDRIQAIQERMKQYSTTRS